MNNIPLILSRHSRLISIRIDYIELLYLQYTTGQSTSLIKSCKYLQSYTRSMQQLVINPKHYKLLIAFTNYIKNISLLDKMYKLFAK